MTIECIVLLLNISNIYLYMEEIGRIFCVILMGYDLSMCACVCLGNVLFMDVCSTCASFCDFC